MTKGELPFCECGCGLRVTKVGNRFINHHCRRGIKHSQETKDKMSELKLNPRPKPEPQLCECGCGQRVSKPGNRWIKGHAWKGKTHTNKSKIKLSEAHLKDPLPIGEKNKIPTNKDCASYLGSLTEQVLSNLFKDVQIMPHGNHGFDFICNQDYKIDAKSCATGNKIGNWQFGIGKNQIADYFLCVAFEDRNNLNPVHLWLIPGKDINHKMGITISKSMLKKWSQYEQPLDKVILCCDERRGE